MQLWVICTELGMIVVNLLTVVESIKRVVLMIVVLVHMSSKTSFVTFL